MALSRPLQPRDRRKRPARKGRAKAACAKTNTDWQLRKVRKILDTTNALKCTRGKNHTILSLKLVQNEKTPG